MSHQPVPLSAPAEPRETVANRGGSPLPWVISLSLAAVVGAMLFAGGYLAAGGPSAAAGCAAPSEEFAAFCEAYARLKTEYVDALSDEKLVEGAIRGMFQYGVEDPNSGYMPPEDYQRALGDLSGKFSGIGAEMGVRNLDDPGHLEPCTAFSSSCVLVVVAPLAGSPADAAGIQSGDIVRSVDGEPVDGFTMSDMIGRIRGEAGTDVTLRIERERQEPFDITITRAEIVMREVSSRIIDGHIGYIKLNGFSDAATDQFREELAGLLEQGVDQIVLDLRDNPGGYIEAARQIAGQFVKEGLLFTQESAGDQVREWRAPGDGVATDPAIEVAVLVNGGSASASEIVTAALQETGRATIIGQPTFGKNTVQIWSALTNQGGIRITVSRWFTPLHNSVAPEGIQPDITVDRPPETPPEQDLVLERALEHLATASVGQTDASLAPAAIPAASVPAEAWMVVGWAPPVRV